MELPERVNPPLKVLSPVTPKVPAIKVLPVASATVNLSVSTAIPAFAFNTWFKVPTEVISVRFPVVIRFWFVLAPVASFEEVLPIRITALFVEVSYAICPSGPPKELA